VLKEEYKKALDSSVLHEVISKSNFYFAVDENKVDKNLKIYNKKAPGVVYHKPSVILEHEHIHIQHYLDPKKLTEDKLTEVYAYYNYLIDLHISQVRPENLDELSYIPPHFNQLETTRN
jgi:hypothetical protein